MAQTSHQRRQGDQVEGVVLEDRRQCGGGGHPPKEVEVAAGDLVAGDVVLPAEAEHLVFHLHQTHSLRQARAVDPSGAVEQVEMRRRGGYRHPGENRPGPEKGPVVGLAVEGHQGGGGADPFR